MGYVMAILGIQDRYWLVAIAVVVLLLVAAFMLRGRRTPKVDVKLLSHDDAARYIEEMDTAERAFLDHPEQSAAGARGIVEEVLRRKGFPDRVDGSQRVKDLATHDKDAAASLKAAHLDLKTAKSGDTERMRKAVQEYRDVLYRLLKVEQTPVGATATAPAADSAPKDSAPVES